MSTVHIQSQTLTNTQKLLLKNYMLVQPQYNHALRKEPYVRKHYNDHPDQHYLWQARNQATSWHDFCMQWGDGSYIKTDRAHLIMPGELFLCDLVGSELWVGRLLPSGRAEKIAQISDDMNRDYGNCFNGYALIPWAVLEMHTEEDDQNARG